MKFHSFSISATFPRAYALRHLGKDSTTEEFQ